MKALATNNTCLLNVIQGKLEHKSYGGKKFGMGLNVEQDITNEVGFFSRIGWDDGKYVTWACTEIDRTANVGLSLKGNRWKRQNDVFEIATVINGISKEHRNFLRAGG